MKTVIIQDEIKKHPQLVAMIDQATSLLEAVLGWSAPLVDVNWSLTTDERGRSVLLLLTIADFTGSETARFAPEELRDAEHMERRLFKLWGDLLQDRSHKQLAKLKQLVQEMEGD